MHHLALFLSLLPCSSLLQPSFSEKRQNRPCVIKPPLTPRGLGRREGQVILGKEITNTYLILILASLSFYMLWGSLIQSNPSYHTSRWMAQAMGCGELWLTRDMDYEG